MGKAVRLNLGATAHPQHSDAMPKGLIRAAGLGASLAVARSFGVDAGLVLSEFGLDESYFEDPDNAVPFTVMGLLIARFADLAECPHLGLLAGERMNTSVLGTIGFLARSAPDVRTALALLCKYFRFHNPNATVHLSDERGFVVLSITLLLPQVQGREHILDGMTAAACNVMRDLCGPEWKAAEIRLARMPPRNVQPYRDFFASALRFNANENSVVFSSAWLSEPLKSADPHLHRAMMKRIGELEQSPAESLASAVRRMLPTLIASRTASAHVVSTLVGLSTRTLNRRLADEGTTYVRLREEARQNTALQLLEGTDLPANEISDRIGYANPSAFTRAFERWTGKAPADWRASLKRAVDRRSRRS